MKAHRLTTLLLLILTCMPIFAAAGQITIKRGDTAYSICKKYQLSTADFNKLNPSVAHGGLKFGYAVNVGTKPAVEVKKTATRSKVVRSAKDMPAGQVASMQPIVDQSLEPVAWVNQKSTGARHGKRLSASTGKAKAARHAQPLDTATKTTRVAQVKELTDKAKPAVVRQVQDAGTVVAKKKPAAKHKRSSYLSYYDSPVGGTKDSEPSVAISLTRIVLSLIFVVALAYVSLLALKRFSSVSATRKTPRRNIKVLETAGLGANRSLHVVQIDGRQLLVGATASQVNLIAELEVSEGQGQEAEQPADFSGLLKRLNSTQQRADTATKLGSMLQEGASFLQKKTSAAQSMRKKGNPDEA